MLQMKKYLLVLLVCFGSTPIFAQTAIDPCGRYSDIHIVVIGSSTAAGAGPSNSANAWVNRYRAYLQNINPNNLVTNLAIGGTRTYHIMPDWFVSPSNRPSPNPGNNVTQAISLGADAIIVNMPSNDGASGYSVNEQMFNFHTIVSVADSADIPVWVCTTQPRNGLSAAQINIQTGVRDSILVAFGSRAIDFWNPFASAGNTILSSWDSGDGVHMNDTAHAVLNQKVITKGIPNEVKDTLAYTDHLLAEILVAEPNSCGDSNMQVGIVTVNLGQSSTVTENIQMQSYDNISANTFNFPLIPVTNLGACKADTSYVTVNSYDGLNSNFDAFILNSADTDITNDTAQQFVLITKGHPTIMGSNDTVFSGANALLTATTGTADTIVWYDAPSGGSILAYGNQYPINNVTMNQTVYPEAVSGPLHFHNSLFTVANTTTDWNGMMFDIVAKGDIIIDSVKIKMNANGPQEVVGYNRMGSAVGNEMIPSAWNAWGTDSVNAAATGDFEIVDLPDVSLQTNDTLGVYLHIQSNNARLSYLNSPAAVYTNSDIAILNGRGVSHTFGVFYSPRNWSGEVFYHYGFNPKGDCQSDRIPVSAIIKFPSSIENIESIGLQIFPNPTNGLIHFKGEKLPKMITIKDIQGRTIRTKTVSHGQLSLSDLQSGLYFLNFELEGKRFAQKIIIE